MIKKSSLAIIAVSVGLTLNSGSAISATSFFEGKIIRIIVGYSAGGGYDLYARAIARHLGRHIPGNPTIIVENMVGAGGLISANHLYKVAKPDGLTIGHFSGGLFFNQVMEQQGIEFDARKFGYVGAPIKSEIVCVLNRTSGITSIEKWMSSKTPIKLGGSAPGTFLDNCIRILRAAIGLPIQHILGYKGVADIRLAVESGEVAGTVGAWDGLKVSWRNSLETGDVIVLLQAVQKPLKDLPNVPLAINLAKKDEGRQLIEVGIHSSSTIIWPFVLPPNVSKERGGILSKAFQETLKDNEFLIEAEKAKMSLDPVTSEELEKAVNRIFKLDPTLLAKMKEILFK